MNCNDKANLILKKGGAGLYSFMLRPLLFCVVFAIASGLFAQPQPAPLNFKKQAAETPSFLENKGQMTDMDGNPVPSVLFRQESQALNLYITEKGLTYLFLKCEEEEHGMKKPHRSFGEQAEEKIKWERVDVALEGATIRKENCITEGKSESHSQYFLAHCPDGIKDVHSYEKLTIQNVYPGIDWVFYNSTEKGVKYDFIVHPGADPGRIRLVYSSRKKLILTEQGTLRVQTSYGDLAESAPETFLDGKLIESHFKNISAAKNKQGGYDMTIGLDIPTFNFQLSTFNSFIIDPQLFWSTFFGGTGYDGPRCVATDNANNVYVTGYSESANFPTQNGGGYYQGTFAGGVRDAFIQKFNNLGVRLLATYYGGSSVDEGWHMAFDAGDNLFLIGYTESANFPVQNAGTFFQGTFGGQGDAFILKFDNAGNRLWATYYGGTGMEEGFGITTDPTGNIFLTGETRSNTTFPLQNSGTFYQGTFGTGVSDAFILKFDNTGNRLWATYAGGWNTDMGFAITSDLAGNVFVTGHAWGGGFPLLNSGTFFQGAITGAGDLFIMKFDNAGTLLWSTYYGGNAVDEGNSIVTDAGGNIFITGSTASSSASFPKQNPGGGAYYQATKGGTWDTYLLKFDNAGNRIWATFFGGTGDETTKEYTYDNLAVDACGNVYMSFETTSSDVPTQVACDGGYFNNAFNGGTYDIFITQFSGTGLYRWGSYLGGDGDDFRSPIAVDDSSSLFMSGEWTDGSPLNPATYPNVNPGGGAYNATFSGGHDGYMVKFDKIQPTLTTTVSNTTCGCVGSASVTPSGNCSPFTYLWSNSQTTSAATGLCSGNYTVTVYNSLCGIATATVSVTSSGGFTVTPTSAPAACLSANGSATITPTGGQSPFTYAWSPTGGTNAIATGLASGSYTVLVTDAGGCTGTTTVTITSTGGPTVSLSNQTNVLCNGGTNGAASVTVSGGTPSYTFNWAPSGGTTSAATGLGAGNFTVTVTDANGCIQTQTVTITQPAPITTSLTATQTTCAGNNGTASVSVSGGTPSYSYVWSNTGTTSQISNLTSQVYSVTITDGNGCTVSNTVAVTASGSVTATANNSTICAGQTATLSAGGGTAYSWSTGATTSVITVTAASTATYSVIVSSGLCSDTAAAVVIVNPQPSANAGNNLTVCIGSQVTLTASGGGTYLWNTGQTSASISAAATAAATYSVIVTNAGGCSDTATVSVFTTPSIVANAGPDQTICAGDNVQLSASGGTGYNWSPAAGLSNPNIYNPIASPATTTNYTVIVTSGSCPPATDVVTVNVSSGPSAVAQSNVTIAQGQSTTLSAGGGGTYSWSNGSTGSVITVSPLATTQYCVFVTDAAGCSDSACVTVAIEPLNCASVSTEDAFVLPSAFSPNADGENDKWRLLYAPLLADCIAEFEVGIYNRWGELVFEGTDIQFVWDGMYKGKSEDTAVFAYCLNAVMKDGTKIKKKGNISLLR